MARFGSLRGFMPPPPTRFGDTSKDHKEGPVARPIPPPQPAKPPAVAWGEFFKKRADAALRTPPPDLSVRGRATPPTDRNPLGPVYQIEPELDPLWVPEVTVAPEQLPPILPESLGPGTWELEFETVGTPSRELTERLVRAIREELSESLPVSVLGVTTRGRTVLVNLTVHERVPVSPRPPAPGDPTPQIGFLAIGGVLGVLGRIGAGVGVLLGLKFVRDTSREIPKAAGTFKWIALAAIAIAGVFAIRAWKGR